MESFVIFYGSFIIYIVDTCIEVYTRDRVLVVLNIEVTFDISSR